MSDQQTMNKEILAKLNPEPWQNYVMEKSLSNLTGQLVNHIMEMNQQLSLQNQMLTMQVSQLTQQISVLTHSSNLIPELNSEPHPFETIDENDQFDEDDPEAQERELVPEGEDTPYEADQTMIDFFLKAVDTEGFPVDQLVEVIDGNSPIES